LIYKEKRLYIHEVGGKKVDMSHRVTTKLTMTNCHQVGSRRQVDTPPSFDLARRSGLYHQSWRGVELTIALTVHRLSSAKAPH
jgi:hypothetical protein